ncbi:hypothetical protein [Paraburkholderia atlantica]|nr:hypothetical protein [Paraburkholderia atlantica]
MKSGYVTSFFALQYGLMILVEYVCKDGHRIRIHEEGIDWQDNRMVWL